MYKYFNEVNKRIERYKFKKKGYNCFLFQSYDCKSMTLFIFEKILKKNTTQSENVQNPKKYTPNTQIYDSPLKVAALSYLYGPKPPFLVK